MLHNSLHRIEIMRREHHHAFGTVILLSDTTAALNVLRGLMVDDFLMRRFRHVFAEASLSSNLTRLSDQEVVQQVARLLVTGRLKLIVRPFNFRNLPPSRGAAQDEDAGTATVGPSAPVRQTALTWITFRVVNDVTQLPIPGVRLLVTLPNGVVGEYQTDEEGLAEITGITPGTCAVTSPIRGACIRDTYAFVALGAPPADEATSEAFPETTSGEPPAASQEASAEEEQALLRSRIARVEQHKVKSGESIKSIAEANGLTWQELAYFNWGTTIPDEINEHLRDDVGCTKKTPDGYNYSFDDADDPGLLYIPKAWKEAGLATAQVHTIRVKEGEGFRIILENEIGLRIPEAEYEVTLADGSKRQGRLGRNGLAWIPNPPPGPVEIELLDLDDVLAKSFAARARQAFDERDAPELIRLLKDGKQTVQQMVEAYDLYFNDYGGSGLLQDLSDELTDPDARTGAQMLLAIADLQLPA